MMKLTKAVGVVLVMAVIAVVLWPAPNPLYGVETVALEDVPDSVSILIDDSVITIGDNTFSITSNPSEADAVITFHSVTSADASLEISSESGFKANVHLVLDVERDGQRSLMDLYVDIENSDVKTRLVGRKFYEVWKYNFTQR